MSKSAVINLAKEFTNLTFVGNRTPTSTDEQLARAFAQLAPYRDGAIFIGHYAGTSEWERHTQGDDCLLYTSPSPRDQRGSRMPSSA